MRIIDTISCEKIVEILHNPETTGRINKTLELALEQNLDTYFSIKREFSTGALFYTKIQCVPEMRPRGKFNLNPKAWIETSMAIDQEHSYAYDKKDVDTKKEIPNSANIIHIAATERIPDYCYGSYAEGNPSNWYSNFLEIAIEYAKRRTTQAQQIKPRAFAGDEEQLDAFDNNIEERKNNTIRCKLEYDPQNRIWKGIDALKPFYVEIIEFEKRFKDKK